ncbi:unnamed protein product [Pylaiella littoralis]
MRSTLPHTRFCPKLNASSRRRGSHHVFQFYQNFAHHGRPGRRHFLNLQRVTRRSEGTNSCRG